MKTCQFLIGKVQRYDGARWREIEEDKVSIPHRQGTTIQDYMGWIDNEIDILCQFLIGKVQLNFARQICS